MNAAAPLTQILGMRYSHELTSYLRMLTGFSGWTVYCKGGPEELALKKILASYVSYLYLIV